MPRQLDLFRYEVRIPTFDWKQIGGDMDPGTYGGTIARADGSSIELLKIQPVREYVGDREAADVGHPFWTREAYFDEDDLQTDKKQVASALAFIGVWDNPDQLQAFKEAAPEDRAVLIAEALLDYGSAEEGTAGWAKDALGGIEVEWWGSPGKKIGYEYIEDEDGEFIREVLGGIDWDDAVGDVARELEDVRDEIAGYDDPEITETDVRLQVHEGSWSVHSGDSSYDQSHRGYWGSSSVSVDDSDATLLETAKALVDEARDAWHEDHPNIPS